jgi:hypothetical protein
MKREDVYKLIDGEREYQNNLWPSHEEAPQLTIGEFVLMLEEYANQARKEWIVEKRPEQKTMAVIRKIGGIAVRAMEIHGAPPRN